MTGQMFSTTRIKGLSNLDLVKVAYDYASGYQILSRRQSPMMPALEQSIPQAERARRDRDNRHEFERIGRAYHREKNFQVFGSFGSLRTSGMDGRQSAAKANLGIRPARSRLRTKSPSSGKPGFSPGLPSTANGAWPSPTRRRSRLTPSRSPAWRAQASTKKPAKSSAKKWS
ncbi:MAG: hypothetical protein RI910_2738 [Verrucomicrobiota bacterium]